MKFIRNKKIKIGKYEFPIRITNRAILEYEELSGDKITNINTTANTLKFLYCICKAGAKSEKKKFEYSYEDFLTIIDDYYTETFTTVIDFLEEEYKSASEDDDLEEVKKKVDSDPVKWSEVYGYCVGSCGIPPLYFLDEMSQDEVAAIMKNKYKSKIEEIRSDWEQTRIISFYSAFDKVGAKSPKKFMPFEWDEPEKPVTILSPEERDRRLKEIMESKKLRTRNGQN